MRTRAAIVICQPAGGSTLSYNDDWLDAFLACKSLSPCVVNIARGPSLKDLYWVAAAELVVLLHSTNTNGLVLPRAVSRALRHRRGKLVFFTGNEYKLMPEKILAIRELGAEYIASQLPLDTAQWLYAECRDSKALSVPHALNPAVFRCEVQPSARTIDIGVRAFEYPHYLGDIDRYRMLEFFRDSSLLKALRTDISFDPGKRFARAQWAGFLNNCLGTVSTEAGSSFLEPDDRTRILINEYVEKYPSAGFADIYSEFFAGYPNPRAGKAVSSRHFDAIGTRTCQIMFVGRFNDILRADEHYIPVAKDFSDICTAVEKLKDDRYRDDMTARALEYALSFHTHAHRINALLKEVGAS